MKTVTKFETIGFIRDINDAALSVTEYPHMVIIHNFHIVVDAGDDLDKIVGISVKMETRTSRFHMMIFRRTYGSRKDTNFAL